jgi:hypothetical protein
MNATTNRQGVQLLEVGYPTQSSSVALASGSNSQLLIHSVSAYNSSSAAIEMGIGVRYQAASWKLHTKTATYTDVTATIQAASTVSMFPTTNNYGVIVQCKNKFGLVSLNVSQAQTGSPVYVYEYYNGSAWTALTLANSPVYSATGNVTLAFKPPVDWAEGSNGDISAFSSLITGYCIRVTASTAPSQAVQINAMYVARMWAVRKVPQYSHLEINHGTTPIVLDAGEGVQPFFSVAAAGNCVEVAYNVAP